MEQAEIFCLPKYTLLFSFHSWCHFFCPYTYKPHIDRPLCKWWKVLLLYAISSGMETYICLCEHGLHTQTYATVYTAGPTCPSAKFHITVLQWVVSVVLFLFRYSGFKSKQCNRSLEVWLRKWRTSLIKRKAPYHSIILFYYSFKRSRDYCLDIQLFKVSGAFPQKQKACIRFVVSTLPSVCPHFHLFCPCLAWQTDRQSAYSVPSHSWNRGYATLIWHRDTYPLLWAGSQAACGKITVSGTPNCLNYCEIFVLYTQFTGAWLRRCTTSRTVPGSIPGGVTWDFFRGSFRQNHVPWGRLSLWKWVPGISSGLKTAGAFGWRPTTLVVPKVEKTRGLNLPGTPRATSVCHGIHLLTHSSHMWPQAA